MEKTTTFDVLVFNKNRIVDACKGSMTDGIITINNKETINIDIRVKDVVNDGVIPVLPINYIQIIDNKKIHLNHTGYHLSGEIIWLNDKHTYGYVELH